MAGHAQLQFVMTECSKTQIRLTGLSWMSQYSAFGTRKLLHDISHYALMVCLVSKQLDTNNLISEQQAF